MAAAPSDGGTGGAFASSTNVYVTTNHGGLWTPRNLPANSGRVQELQVDAANPLTAYACVNTFPTNNTFVWKTTTGGASWSSIQGNLPMVPAWSLQIDPNNGRLYVSNELGVYSSTDSGTTWSRFGTGLPNGQAVQIEFNRTLHMLGAATRRFDFMRDSFTFMI